MLEVVLARFAAEGVGPAVGFGLCVAAGVLDGVGADSLSFLFGAVRFRFGSATTITAGRESGCCGALDDVVDRGSVEPDVTVVET